MGKNKDGRYVPPKGKPSGNGRESHQLKDAFAAIDPETENELAAKYTADGTDDIAGGIHVRHMNRNTHKGEDMGAAAVNDDK